MKNDNLSPEEFDRYKVRHRVEIERVLQGIMDARALVTVAGGADRQLLVTTIIAVSGKERAVYLGSGDDPRQNDALLNSAEVIFTSNHEHIKVQFGSRSMKLVTIDSTRAFQIPMPDEILRFQRREFYRLTTPMVNPVKCRIHAGADVVEAAVVDISIGGVGILSYESGGQLRAGEVYHGCEISLPDTGHFLVSMKVCSTYEVVLKSGMVSHRAGCQFINLPVSVETEIQRYIFRVERERRTHS